MKKVLHVLKKHIQSLFSDQTAYIPIDPIFPRKKKAAPKLSLPVTDIDRLEAAEQASSIVHLIYSRHKSVTGQIQKLDLERGQVILKSPRRNMTTIVRLTDIQRIRILPTPTDLEETSKKG